MKLFFPELVRAIDMARSRKRVAAVNFCGSEPQKTGDEPSAEEVARRKKTAPTTVPNDAKSSRL